MLVEMKLNELVKIYGIIHVRNQNLQEEWILQFRKEIVKSIEDRNAIAASDTSVKNRQIVGCWIIANKIESKLERNMIYHKIWSYNM